MLLLWGIDQRRREPTNVNIRVDHCCVDNTPLANEDMVSNLMETLLEWLSTIPRNVRKQYFYLQREESDTFAKLLEGGLIT